MGIPTYAQLAHLMVLAQGRHPEWVEQSTINIGGEPGPPSGGSAGVSLGVTPDGYYAVVTLLRVQLRRVPSVRRTDIEIGTFDAATTYTVTVNGNDYTSDGEADEAAAYDELKTNIDGGSEPGMTVTDGTTYLRLEADDYTCSVSAAGGTGTISITDVEASEVTFSVHLYPVDQTELTDDDQWDESGGLEFTITKNWQDRAITSGNSRAFIEIKSTNGNNVVPAVGPCDSPY